MPPAWWIVICRIALWLATTGLPAVAPLRIGEGWVWKGWVSWIKVFCLCTACVRFHTRIKFITESLWHDCRSIEWPAALTCGAFIGTHAVAGGQCGANTRHDGAGVTGLLRGPVWSPVRSPPWNGRPLDRQSSGCVQLLEDSLKCLSFGSSLSGVYTNHALWAKIWARCPPNCTNQVRKVGWAAALYTYRLGQVEVSEYATYQM